MASTLLPLHKAAPTTTSQVPATSAIQLPGTIDVVSAAVPPSPVESMERPRRMNDELLPSSQPPNNDKPSGKMFLSGEADIMSTTYSRPGIPSDKVTATTTNAAFSSSDNDNREESSNNSLSTLALSTNQPQSETIKYESSNTQSEPSISNLPAAIRFGANDDNLITAATTIAAVTTTTTASTERTIYQSEHSTVINDRSDKRVSSEKDANLNGSEPSTTNDVRTVSPGLMTLSSQSMSDIVTPTERSADEIDGLSLERPIQTEADERIAKQSVAPDLVASDKSHLPADEQITPMSSETNKPANGQFTLATASERNIEQRANEFDLGQQHAEAGRSTLPVTSTVSSKMGGINAADFGENYEKGANNLEAGKKPINIDNGKMAEKNEENLFDSIAKSNEHDLMIQIPSTTSEATERERNQFDIGTSVSSNEAGEIQETTDYHVNSASSTAAPASTLDNAENRQLPIASTTNQAFDKGSNDLAPQTIIEAKMAFEHAADIKHTAATENPSTLSTMEITTISTLETTSERFVTESDKEIIRFANVDTKSYVKINTARKPSTDEFFVPADDDQFVPPLPSHSQNPTAMNTQPSLVIPAREQSTQPPSIIVPSTPDLSVKSSTEQGKASTVARDSDTIFYISNTEVKVVESAAPTPNSKQENQFFPALYEEDVIIDFPGKNSSGWGNAVSSMTAGADKFEEDIILSPMKSNFDPTKLNDENLSISYVGESFIDIKEANGDDMSTASNNNDIALAESFARDSARGLNDNAISSNVIIEPAVITDVQQQQQQTIGVPVIAELPPQIDIRDLDYKNDVAVQLNNTDNSIASQLPVHIGDNLQKAEQLTAEIPKTNAEIAAAAIEETVTASNLNGIVDSVEKFNVTKRNDTIDAAKRNDTIDAGKMQVVKQNDTINHVNVNATTTAETIISNATAASILNDDPEPSKC